MGAGFTRTHSHAHPHAHTHGDAHWADQHTHRDFVTDAYLDSRAADRYAYPGAADRYACPGAADQDADSGAANQYTSTANQHTGTAANQDADSGHAGSRSSRHAQLALFARDDACRVILPAAANAGAASGNVSDLVIGVELGGRASIRNGPRALRLHPPGVICVPVSFSSPTSNFHRSRERDTLPGGEPAGRSM